VIQIQTGGWIMKKIVSFIICVSMLLSIMVIPVSAAKGKVITYTTADENYFEEALLFAETIIKDFEECYRV
jgi:hypothetical protein